MARQIEKVLKILAKSQKGMRKTNLNREAKDTKNYTPFQTLISCIISLRVRDETAEKISKQLFKVADTPEKILALDKKKLEKLIYSSGYYRNKAKVIKNLSKKIIEVHKGEVPKTEEELLELYGVGRKTANIVLAFAYDKVVIPVDVNVHRISNRLGWVRTKNDFNKTEKALEKILPKKYWREINGLFLLHGRGVCVPVSPRCSVCVVRDYCERIGVGRAR